MCSNTGNLADISWGKLCGIFDTNQPQGITTYSNIYPSNRNRVGVVYVRECVCVRVCVCACACVTKRYTLTSKT